MIQAVQIDILIPFDMREIMLAKERLWLTHHSTRAFDLEVLTCQQLFETTESKKHHIGFGNESILNVEL